MKSLEQTCLKNTRFGDLEINPKEILNFPEGLIGFPHETEFLLISTPQASLFYWLQSTTNASLAFLVTEPTTYVPDYQPSLAKSDGEQIFTTVNIPHGHPELMTLNLAGPIRIEVQSRKGNQIVLDHEAYTTKYRVFAGQGQTSEGLAA